MKHSIFKILEEAVNEAQDCNDLIPNRQAVRMMLDYACLIQAHHEDARCAGAVDPRGGIEVVFRKTWGRITLLIGKNGDDPSVVVVRDGKVNQYTWSEFNPDI